MTKKTMKYGWIGAAILWCAISVLIPRCAQMGFLPLICLGVAFWAMNMIKKRDKRWQTNEQYVLMLKKNKMKEYLALDEKEVKGIRSVCGMLMNILCFGSELLMLYSCYYYTNVSVRPYFFTFQERWPLWIKALILAGSVIGCLLFWLSFKKASSALIDQWPSKEVMKRVGR